MTTLVTPRNNGMENYRLPQKTAGEIAEALAEINARIAGSNHRRSTEWFSDSDVLAVYADLRAAVAERTEVR